MASQPDLLQSLREYHPSLTFGGGLRVPNEVFASMAQLRFHADTGESFADMAKSSKVLVHRHPRKESVIVTMLAEDRRDSHTRVCQYRISLSGEVTPTLYPWIQSKNERLKFQSDFVTSYRIQHVGSQYTVQVLCKVSVGSAVEYLWQDWLVTDEKGFLHEYHEGGPVTLGQVAKFATVMNAMDVDAVKRSAGVWNQALSCAELPAFRSLPYDTALMDFQLGYLTPRQPRLTLERFCRSFANTVPTSLIRL